MINTHLLKQGDDEFERMRVFCTLRHFPELKTSLAHAPKLTIPRALSRDELKASKKIPRVEPSTSNRKTLNKLCGSALSDINDPYHNVKANMRVQRDRHRHTQMSLLFQEGRPFPQHPEYQPTSNVDYDEILRCNPLYSACDKLSQVGISFGLGSVDQCINEGTLEREVGSCGLLSVLGLPTYIRSAPAASPASGNRPSSGAAAGRARTGDNSAAEHERLLSERLEIVLGVRLEPEETTALHAALYAHLR